MSEIYGSYSTPHSRLLSVAFYLFIINILVFFGMETVTFNFSWIAFNIFLAFIPIVFGQLTYMSRNKILKLLSGVIWILFLPNTLYLFTDLVHFPDDLLKTDPKFYSFLIIEYLSLVFLGSYTYIMSVHPIEKLIQKSRRIKKYTLCLLFCIHLATGFGVVMGRIERANSWYVLTKPTLLIHAIVNISTSLSLLFFVVIVTTGAAILYRYFIPFFITTKRKNPS